MSAANTPPAAVLEALRLLPGEFEKKKPTEDRLGRAIERAAEELRAAIDSLKASARR